MRSECEAIELSRQLTAAFYGLDVDQRHNREKPTVIGVTCKGPAGAVVVVVACPFCGQSHVHELRETVEYRGAGCSEGQGYWVICYEK